MANSNLKEAKAAKNDEFYTQFHDIEIEMNAYLEYDPDVFRGKTVLLPCDDPEWSNFTRFFAAKFDELGLKKLISTSYAPDAKKMKLLSAPTLFETDAPQFDPSKAQTKGKIFILDKDLSGDGRINIDDLQWEYLNGDGDFRSKEVSKLRDEADIIITNPPFSLFREFLAWIVSADKKFIIIGNMNAVTYKETFPLIKGNRMWMGYSIHSGDREFEVPEEYPLNAAGWRIDENGRKFIRVKGVRWFTNIDHGRRHEPLCLMTMADNLRYKPADAQIGSGLWYPYNEDAAAVATKGYLYDYKVASGGSMSTNPPVRGICPEGWHIPDRSELQALAESPNRPDDFFCIAGFRTVTDLESRYGDSKKSMLIGVASSSTHCDVLSFTTTTEPILTSMSTRYGMSLRCVKD